MTASAIIVGAGAFGVSAALELRKRGFGVDLVDPGPVPHPDASSADISKAIRMDYGGDAFYMELAERSIAVWREWNAGWEEPLYHETGFLIMARTSLKAGSFEGDGFALLQARGHRPRRVDSRALARDYPAWRADDYPDGYFNPDAGYAESGRVVRHLAELAVDAGVRLRQGFEVSRLQESDSRVDGVIAADGTRLRGDVVVVATGAWTPALLPHLAPLLQAVGQPVLHFRPADPQPYRAARFPVWAADISNTGWYGFPVNEQGVLKVGNHGPGRPIDPGARREVDRAVESRCREFFARTFPGLADAPLVGSRLCLYCDSRDGDFLIDRDPERDGLIVASGGSGHGFKFVPLLGRIVADVIEGADNPFASRFAWRAAGPRNTEQARHGG